MKRTLIYITTVLLLNIAATTIFFRIDLTENRSYSLSKASIDLVESLEEPLTIKVFLSENLPVPYNTMERDIRDILMEYQLKANKHFNYTIDIIDKDNNDIDPSIYGIYPVNIQNIEADEMKVVSAYIGMAFIHGDLIESLPAIEYNQNLELIITEKIRKLTEKTTALLGMKENIKATLYLSPILYALSDELKSYPSSLEKEIEELKSDYFNRLDFTLVESNDIKNSNMTTLNVEDESGNVTKATASLVVENGEESSVINIIKQDLFGRSVISPANQLTGDIASTIDKMIGAQTKIGYVTSNETLDINGQNSGLSAFSSMISNEYKLAYVDLADGGIDDDIKTLIIAGPKTQFSKRELFILDQFLMKGNSILLALDQVQLDMEKSNPSYGYEVYKTIDHGLFELLKSYGIAIDNGMVMDKDSFKQVQRGSNGSLIETQIYFAPQIDIANINNEPSFMKGITDLITFRMSEVSPIDSDDPSTTSLFSSSKNAWSVESDNLTLTPGRISLPAEYNQYSLAVMKEGSFNSYFTDKEIPLRDIKDGDNSEENLSLSGVEEEERVIEKSENGKLIVLGSSDMISDSLLSKDHPSNQLMMQNIIDYLSGRGDYTLMRSKGVYHRPMIETTTAQRNLIKYINIIGLPLLTAIAGLIIYVLWLRRKKNIMHFFKEDSNEK